jgi:hypothetical protein
VAYLRPLGSFDLNQRKECIDITRGDTIQFRGGAGKTLRRASKILPSVDLGLAGYGLWQVRDNRGAALPRFFAVPVTWSWGWGPKST